MRDWHAHSQAAAFRSLADVVPDVNNSNETDKDKGLGIPHDNPASLTCIWQSCASWLPPQVLSAICPLDIYQGAWQYPYQPREIGHCVSSGVRLPSPSVVCSVGVVLSRPVLYCHEKDGRVQRNSGISGVTSSSLVAYLPWRVR